MRFALLLLALLLPNVTFALHGYALWDDLKYPAGFDHFDYVNKDAPKGGDLRLVSNLRFSTFDKYNPFTIKGTPPAYLSELMFDSLLAGSADEPGAGYGLLADSVSVSDDHLSAVFRIRKDARFHNGDRVLAQDVKFSVDTLMGPFVSPGIRSALEDVASVEVLDEHTVRFKFKKPNRELPLTVGGLPIFSHRWGEVDGKPRQFDQIVMDIPIGSGPYRIGPVNFGKDITYVLDDHYWAKDLNVRRGMFNFERITVKIYKDNTARLEALKAGEFDLMRFFSAHDWERLVFGRKFDSGELVKKEFRHRLPSGFQSYVLNTRRELLKDVRVREALGLALDFEWMKRQLFFGAYQRVLGLFGNTDCHSEGLPDKDELALLEPWRNQIPAAAFGQANEPPRTDRENGLRDNLRKAQTLLKEAGWQYRDGALRNSKGDAFTLEYLDSNEAGARVVTPWVRNLEKLGIKLVFHPVDFSLYQERLQKFDFDITSLAYGGSINPGQEYSDLFGSKAATQEDSGNHTGIQSPAVDALISRMVAAKTKKELLPACRALERVIVNNHILVPQWSAPTHRMAYNAWRLQPASEMPPYASGETWAIDTWWSRSAGTK